MSHVQVEDQGILVWGPWSWVHMLIAFCYSNCREAIVPVLHIIMKNTQCHTNCMNVIKVMLIVEYHNDVLHFWLNCCRVFLISCTCFGEWMPPIVHVRFVLWFGSFNAYNMKGWNKSTALQVTLVWILRSSSSILNLWVLYITNMVLWCEHLMVNLSWLWHQSVYW
jgi:hypothetical protein